MLQIERGKLHVNRLSPSGTITRNSCINNYIGELKCPEKKQAPSAPEIFIPKKHTKKASAEAKEINAQRLKEFKNKSDQYIASLGNSNCELNIYIDSKADENYLHTIIGAITATIYEDQYLFYSDGIDMTMYDLKLKKELWSLSH